MNIMNIIYIYIYIYISLLLYLVIKLFKRSFYKKNKITMKYNHCFLKYIIIIIIIIIIIE